MAGPFQPCPNVASFEMLYGVNGQNCENVYHILSDTGWDPTTLSTIGGYLEGWESASAVPSRHAQCALFNIHCRDLSVAGGAEVDVTPASPIVGTNASTPLPNNVTIAVKWVTGKAGRSFRGRTFHLGLAENQFIGNVLTAGTSAGLITMYNGLQSTIASHAGYHLVVLSRRSGGAPRPTGVPTNILNCSMVDLALDSQRRRLLNHNRHR